MKKIFIIDNHPLTRRGLAALLDARAGLSVCGQADTVNDAVAQIETCQPDLVVVDLLLPGMQGLATIERLHRHRPALPILVFTERTRCVLRALQAGARGYVFKQGDEEEIVQAIRYVLAGKVYVSEDLCGRLLLELASDPVLSPGEALSDRELEVFEGAGRGLDTSALAKQLGVSPKTIDSYRRRIRSKLRLKGSAELIQRAVHWVRDGEVC